MTRQKSSPLPPPRRFAGAGRDLGIVARAVWPNVALFVVMILSAALLLQWDGGLTEGGFLRYVVAVYHLARHHYVPDLRGGWLASGLALALPLMTLAILGEGALRVLALYAGRRRRREEWDPMVAETFRKHTVICGLGELGRAIYQQIVTDHPETQVVLVDNREGVMEELAAVGPQVCEVHGDLTSKATLAKANCQAAKTIIITSGNDGFNLEAAFKARELNPEADIYVRLYRKGLTSLIDAATMPKVHFFCPYDRAAETLAGKIKGQAP